MIRRSLCYICKRYTRTYNDFYDYHLSLSKRSILFPYCDKLRVLEALQTFDVKRVTVRDVLSFDNKKSAIATFPSTESSDSVIRGLDGRLKTISLSRDIRKRVDLSLNSKNHHSTTTRPLIPRGLNVEDEIQVNHLMSCNQGADLENRFFVYSQFVELSKLRMANLNADDYLGELFGNSMSGFGSKCSDIDISFNPSTDKSRREVILGLKDFFDKMKRKGEMFSSCQGIFHASVPLVCFEHRFLPVNGDLAGCHQNAEMLQSRLNFIYARMNPLFPPVYTAIKQILRHFDLMASYKTGYITSFHILIMYLHFLMTEKLAPSIESVLNSTHGTDLGNVDPKMFYKGTNNKSSEDLLLGFFDFIASVDFTSFQLDPIAGQLQSRSFKETRPLIVLNPLNSEHNITKSVSDQKLERLQHTSRQILTQRPKSLADFFNINMGRKQMGVVEKIWHLDTNLNSENNFVNAANESVPSFTR